MKHEILVFGISFIIFFGKCNSIYNNDEDHLWIEKYKGYENYMENENETIFCVDPSSSCENEGEGSKVADPFNCQSYFVCGNNGKVEPGNCLEDEYFDTISGECVPFITDDSCSAPCDCEYDEYDDIKYICDPYRTCTKLDDYCLVPNPLDCHTYFECSSFSEILSEISCADTYGFDVERHYCTEEQSNCSNSCPCEYDKYAFNICDPPKSCELLGPDCLVPDPEDPQKYYTCDIDDREIELKSRSCSDNLIFNTDKHYCTNVVGTNKICNCSYESNPDYCNPVNYCANLDDNCLVPDPNDGLKYYNCISFKNKSVFERFDCPSGTYFDLEQHFCTDDQPEYEKPCHCNYDLYKANPCNPSKACEVLGADCLVPDPFNCRSYYSCSDILSSETNQQIRSRSCPDGFYFNMEKHYCTLEITHCTSPCSCSYSPEKDPCSPISTCENHNDECLVINPFNCHYYFECSTFKHDNNNEEIIRETFRCPDGQYFDSTLHLCTNELSHCSNVCGTCDYGHESVNPCDPFQSCKVLGYGCLVPDPNDRHSFFICSNSSNYITDSQTCPSGFYFDYEETHYCEKETDNYVNPCDCSYNAQEVDACNSFDFCGESQNCLIPDANDCHNYYSCGNTSITLSCPEDFYYDTERGYCVESDGNCLNTCNCADMESEIQLCDDPSDTCQQLGNAGYLCKVIDPSDCHNYFDCTAVDNETFIALENPSTCEDGFYFSFTEQKCLRDTNSCDRKCVNYNCTYECQTSNMNISDPTSCSNYFSCEDVENPTPRSCDDSAKYFNGVECTTNKNTCCDSCEPYCPDTFIEVADPCNCKNYYLCQFKGRSDEDLKFNCPEGQHFDESDGICVDGGTCQSRCTNCAN